KVVAQAQGVADLMQHDRAEDLLLDPVTEGVPFQSSLLGLPCQAQDARVREVCQPDVAALRPSANRLELLYAIVGSPGHRAERAQHLVGERLVGVEVRVHLEQSGREAPNDLLVDESRLDLGACNALKAACVE